MSIAAYPEYDAFRATTVPHLQLVPAHWEIRRVKYAAIMKSEKIFSAASSLPYLGMENVESWSGRILEGNSEVEGLATTFRKGDVLFGKLRPYLAKVAKPDFSGLCSSEFLVFESTEDTSADYLAYALRTSDFISLVNGSTYGAKMPRANPSFVENSEIPFPPLPEQRAIAAFLDKKCAKIDEAVRIKEQQIKLLRERRQILIQQAVTRGLNPDAPMKDSGIDWIGQIPEHWEVRRNFTLFREIKNAGNEELPVLSVSIHSGVSREELSEEESIRSVIKIADRSSYKEVLPGDIAYNMMRAWQGGIGAVHTHGMVSPAYVVARPTDAMVGEYFELLYRTPAFIWQMDAHSKGITDFRKRLYWDDFRNLMTIVPSKAEQQLIIRYADQITQKFSKAITIKESQITALKEYKTTLINAAVTGKIKVVPDRWDTQYADHELLVAEGVH